MSVPLFCPLFARDPPPPPVARQQQQQQQHRHRPDTQRESERESESESSTRLLGFRTPLVVVICISIPVPHPTLPTHTLIHCQQTAQTLHPSCHSSPPNPRTPPPLLLCFPLLHQLLLLHVKHISVIYGSRLRHRTISSGLLLHLLPSCTLPATPPSVLNKI